MRQLVSTALIALVVGSLAGATAGTVAQTEEPDDVAPAAVSGNADRVDGRHAVGAGASKQKRATKLVATNKRGLLPSNIVRPYWRLILDKPAVLADDQVRWNEVGGKPGGFADGVDDVGVAALTVTRIEAVLSADPGSFTLNANCPSGSFVVGGGFDKPLSSTIIYRSYPLDRDTWRVAGSNGHSTNVIMRGYAICLASTPAGAISGSANY